MSEVGSSPGHRLHRIFAGARVALLDFRCGAARCERGLDELAQTDELVFVRSGAFEREVRGERRWVDATQVMLLRGGEPYRIAHPAGGGDRCTVLALGDGMLEDALGEQQTRALATTAPVSGVAFALQSRLIDAGHRSGLADALAVDEALMRLVAAATSALARAPRRARAAARSSTRERRRELVLRAQRLLALRALEPLRLARIAHDLGASPFHLARLFRAASGVPLHRHRNRLRLRRALQRIASGERDLTMLALEHGFSSHSHFDVAFAREFGFPPSALRKPLTARRLREMSKILEV